MSQASHEFWSKHVQSHDNRAKFFNDVKLEPLWTLKVNKTRFFVHQIKQHSLETGGFVKEHLAGRKWQMELLRQHFFPFISFRLRNLRTLFWNFAKKTKEKRKF